MEDYGSYSKGISASKLCEKGVELHKRFPRKKFVLAAFNAFRENEKQEQNFQKSKRSWECVMIFDKTISSKSPYTYNISLPELEKNNQVVLKFALLLFIKHYANKAHREKN